MAKKSRLSAFIRLFRIEHAFMLAFAVLLSQLAVSATTGIPLPNSAIILISLGVPFLIEMGSFALNDYMDEKTDHENGRTDRPLVSGELDATEALAAAAFCYMAGVFIAVGLPFKAFAIAASFAILSVAYNYRLKDTPLLGNIYIAGSMAIPFIFGNLIMTDGIILPVAAIAGVAFASGFGREIIKSAEDIEGDAKHRRSKTLPVIIGKKNACILAAAVYFLLVPLSVLPFAAGLPANLLSVGLTAITAVSFAALGISALRSQEKENLASLRKASLITMGLGLAGYAASLIAI